MMVMGLLSLIVVGSWTVDLLCVISDVKFWLGDLPSSGKFLLDVDVGLEGVSIEGGGKVGRGIGGVRGIGGSCGESCFGVNDGMEI